MFRRVARESENLFPFPSHLRSEAFGISLLEGAMFGKPMISSEIGTGTSYINIAGETGLVVPPNAPQALHEAMRQLWEHPEQAAQMGARAEERCVGLDVLRLDAFEMERVDDQARELAFALALIFHGSDLRDAPC